MGAGSRHTGDPSLRHYELAAFGIVRREQIFPAGIIHLKVIRGIRQPCSSRVLRTAIEVHITSNNVTLDVLVDSGACIIRCEDSVRELLGEDSAG